MTALTDDAQIQGRGSKVPEKWPPDSKSENPDLGHPPTMKRPQSVAQRLE